jgi:hypothetical protein
VDREPGDLADRANQALADDERELLPGGPGCAHPPHAPAGVSRLILGHPGEVPGERAAQRVVRLSLIVAELNRTAIGTTLG